VIGGTEDDHADAATAVDVSANRVAFELSGPDAADVLAQGCSLDLDLMAPGGCAQTLLARAQVILYRPDAETFGILVRPSFAGYLRAWLLDATA
jgi:sarcosine oxidase subunit gamma